MLINLSITALKAVNYMTNTEAVIVKCTNIFFISKIAHNSRYSSRNFNAQSKQYRNLAVCTATSGGSVPRRSMWRNLNDGVSWRVLIRHVVADACRTKHALKERYASVLAFHAHRDAATAEGIEPATASLAAQRGSHRAAPDLILNVALSISLKPTDLLITFDGLLDVLNL